ncbi:MAG: carbohydrate ABC transporter permease [Pseudomonadota bacterium]
MTRRIPLHLALFSLALLTLAPFAWMLAASFMPAGEASAIPPRLWPSAPTLQHYRDLFTRMDMARYALNSALIALLATLLSTLINAMAGYAFAKLRFAGRETLFRSLLAAMVIPAQVAMLPLFLMLKEMGLINTYGGVLVPLLASIFGIFLVRQYAQDIPDAMLDAARLDGAGEFRLFWAVVLPMLRPILATLALFTFMGSWNDFMWPLIVLSDGAMHTLPVALANLSGEHMQDTELMMAASTLTVLPVLIVFLLLQKQYIAGLTQGSLKG